MICSSLNRLAFIVLPPFSVAGLYSSLDENQGLRSFRPNVSSSIRSPTWQSSAPRAGGKRLRIPNSPEECGRCCC
jgi:hypothetical protein